MDWQRDVLGVNQPDAMYAEAREEGRLYTVQWKDLARASAVLPTLETAGRELIEQKLGYLPHDNCVLEQEAFIRALIQAHRTGYLSDADFEQQVDEHIKLIRNADMRHNTCWVYDAAIYDNYWETYVPFGYAVKSRLEKFLGYIPELRHSLIAEMWLRNVIAQHEVHLPEYPMAVDYRAIALIKYREVLLDQGKSIADLSLFEYELFYM